MQCYRAIALVESWVGAFDRALSAAVFAVRKEDVIIAWVVINGR